MSQSSPNQSLTTSFHDHFIYNSNYRILICRTCQFALLPKSDAIRLHLQRVHRYLDLDLRKQCLADAKTLDLASIEELQSLIIDEPIQYIQGLQLLDGLRCDACQYLCGTLNSINLHCREKHKWTWGQEHKPMWKSCHIQTFFPSERRKFFQVHPPLPESPPPQITTDTLIEQLLQRKRQSDDSDQSQLTIVPDLTQCSRGIGAYSWYRGTVIGQLH